MTTKGGTDNYGVIYSFDVTSNTYTDIHNFDSLHGSLPYGGLVQADNGKLYGMTTFGGTNNMGTLFSYDISNNTFVDLVDFNGTNGALPQRSLYKGYNGKLFGTTRNGGTYDYGVLFNYDINTNMMNTILNLDSAIYGGHPDGDFVESNPYFYSGISYFNAIQSISIYPNPNNGNFTLSYHLSSPNNELKITDVLGRTVYTYNIAQQEGTQTIDVSTLSNGVYFYKISNEKETTSGKFVILR